MLALLVDAAEGIVEQAEHRLDRQNPADRLVEHRLRNRAAADEIGQIFAVEAALHAHVDAGEEREARGIAPVLCIARGNHFLVPRIVGDDEALETPFAAQQVGLQPAIAGRRHAVDLVERGHAGQRARIERRLVGRQIDLAQAAVGHVHHVVVEARFTRAVGREMLHAGHQMIGRSQICALEAAHSGRSEQFAEQHVLATTFDSTSPALVAGDVDHRREGPVDSGARRLERRRGGGAAGEFRLEACDLGERHREHGAMPVDDVGGEDQRDLEPRSGHHRRLHDPRHAGAIAVEDPGQLALPRFFDLALEVGPAARRIEGDRNSSAPRRCHQAQLAGFFLERHSRRSAGPRTAGRRLGRPPAKALGRGLPARRRSSRRLSAPRGAKCACRIMPLPPLPAAGA